MKNIITVIPARLNSKRVKHKMLLPFNNKPLIKNVFDKVIDMGLETFVIINTGYWNSRQSTIQLDFIKSTEIITKKLECFK